MFLTMMLIFLCGFIYFACAYFESRSTRREIVITTRPTSAQLTKSTQMPTASRANVHNKTSKRLCSSSDCVRAASYLLESMDLEADPCEDFYQFTCGNWHNYHIRYCFHLIMIFLFIDWLWNRLNYLMKSLFYADAISANWAHLLTDIPWFL